LSLYRWLKAPLRLFRIRLDTIWESEAGIENTKIASGFCHLGIESEVFDAELHAVHEASLFLPHQIFLLEIWSSVLITPQPSALCKTITQILSQLE
jgi:hypothetical protein